MTPKQLRTEDYTVGWICALVDELTAARMMFDERHETPALRDTSNSYHAGSICGHNTIVAGLPAGQLGTVSAASVVTEMGKDFPSIRFCLMVGIGGGVPDSGNEVRLGDVVISKPCYAHGGVVQYRMGQFGSDSFTRIGSLNAPPAILLKAVTTLMSDLDFGYRDPSIYLDVGNQREALERFRYDSNRPDKLFKNDYIHADGQDCEQCDASRLVTRKPRLSGNKFSIHCGTIASDNQVMKNALERDKISKELGGVLCFEMEAAGLMNNIPCLVIRGLCDWSDSHKNYEWQSYAALTASATAKEILSIVRCPNVDSMEPLHRVLESLRDEKKETEAQKQTDILRQMPHAIRAVFNSYENQNRSRCLNGTRTNVLTQIFSWVDKPDEACLFCLNGLAGTGKSTIAFEISEHYSKSSQLGATFFFERGGGDAGHAQLFFTTIASQLAIFSPFLKDSICQAFLQDKDIHRKMFREQWKTLIEQPLTEFSTRPECPESPLVFVIDALDECESFDDLKLIIRLLSDVRKLKGVKARVFMTSRPEEPIREALNRLPVASRRDLILHEVPDSDVNEDLAKYYQEELHSHILAYGNVIGGRYEKTLDELVERASGLFIWAATATRFIQEGQTRFGPRRLQEILRREASSQSPNMRLNEIYTMVLRNSISDKFRDKEKEEVYTMVKTVLGAIVLLFSPLSPNALGCLLGLDKNDDVRWALDQLHSIVALPEQKDRPIRAHHPSLRDFLTDKSRSAEQFWVDEREMHKIIAFKCIGLMSKELRQNMCNLLSPADPRPHSDRVGYAIPPDIQYACQHWVRHLKLSGYQLHDHDDVHKFLDRQLLHWLEALSLYGRLWESIQMITELQNQCTKGEDLLSMLYDSNKFVRHNAFVLEHFPLQVYISALCFSPQQSTIRQKFSEELKPFFKQTPCSYISWGSALQVLEGHKDKVRRLTFSPSAKLLASASQDYTIKLWDTFTGTLKATLKGDSSLESIAFSPDSSMLVSRKSKLSSIKLWNANTTALQAVLDHKNPVTDACFSPDSQTIASASKDGWIQLWSPDGRQELAIRGHIQRVLALQFEPSKGELLASSSDDTTVKIWKTDGQLYASFIRHDAPVNVMRFSPIGSVLASASTDGILNLWDMTSRTLLSTTQAHSNKIFEIKFSEDSQIIVSRSVDGDIKVWNSTTAAHLKNFEYDDRRVSMCSSSPNNDLLAFGSYDSDFHRIYVEVVNYRTGQQLDGEAISWHEVNNIAISSNGEQVAFASTDTTIGLLDLSVGGDDNLLGILGGRVISIKFSPSGRYFASFSLQTSVHIWDSSSGTLQGTLTSYLLGDMNAVLTDREVILAGGSPTIQVWNIDCRFKMSLAPNCGELRGILYCDTTRVLASLAQDGTVNLWDIELLQLRATIKKEPGRTLDCFSADGSILKTTSGSGIIELWDSSTGNTRARISGQITTISLVVLSSDNRYLISTSPDLSLNIYDTNGKKLARYSNLRWRVRKMVISPNNELLACTFYDGTLALWSFSTQSMLVTLRHPKKILKLAISSDNLQIAAEDRNSITIWGVSGELVQIIPLSGGPLTTLSFGSKGHICTNLGPKYIGAMNPGIPPSETCCGLGMSEDGDWIHWKGQKLIWVPLNFRGVYNAQNSRIALGSPTGRVILLQLNEARMNSAFQASRQGFSWRLSEVSI